MLVPSCLNLYVYLAYYYCRIFNDRLVISVIYMYQIVVRCQIKIALFMIVKGCNFCRIRVREVFNEIRVIQ